MRPEGVKKQNCQKCGAIVYSDFKYPVCLECKMKIMKIGNHYKVEAEISRLHRLLERLPQSLQADSKGIKE